MAQGKSEQGGQEWELVESVSADPPAGVAVRNEFAAVPAIVAAAGDAARERFIHFFAATIRNRNTRRAYAGAVRQFVNWLELRGARRLEDVTPVVVAAYIESLGKPHADRPHRLGDQRAKKRLADPSTKQHLAAIRALFDHLVTGGILPFNPAASVRGPKYVITQGKTPVLEDDQMETLLNSIDTSTLVGLRDRALIGIMAFNFARIGAVAGLKVGDYFQGGKRWRFRLHEKGGKYHELPAHHRAEELVDAYLEAMEAAGVPLGKDEPLFRTTRGRSGLLTERQLTENDALRMVKRRSRDAGLPSSTQNHTFRATCITNFRRRGGSRSKAAQLAAHASERTTALYDRSDDPVTIDEIERVNYRSDGA